MFGSYAKYLFKEIVSASILSRKWKYLYMLYIITQPQN